MVYIKITQNNQKEKKRHLEPEQQLLRLGC